MRVGRSFAFVGVFCAGLVVWGPPALAQNLGGGRGRLIENGPVDVEQLARRASLIVRGFVTAGEPTWIGRVIFTKYDVVVLETLKGEPRTSVVVAVAGGALGNVRLAVPGAPQLGVGDELVFFGLPLEGESSFTPVGTFDGIIPIHPGGGDTPATVAPRGAPEALGNFLQEIRTLSGQP